MSDDNSKEFSERGYCFLVEHHGIFNLAVEYEEIPSDDEMSSPTYMPHIGLYRVKSNTNGRKVYTLLKEFDGTAIFEQAYQWYVDNLASEKEKQNYLMEK